MPLRKIAIIGAGLCGLVAARRLHDEGHDVRVFDKGRGTGGRLATRRTSRGIFDHGAPVVQHSTDAFAQFLDTLNTVRGEEGHVGTPGMSALVKPLTDGLNITNDLRIVRLRRDRRAWSLFDAAGWPHGPFDIVLLTVPAPQAAELLDTAAPVLAEAAYGVTMAPMWTCMMAFDTRLDLPDTVGAHGPLWRADRGTAKPDRPAAPETWVAHFTPEFSHDNIDRDAPLIAPDLAEMFSDAVGVSLPPPRHLGAHRWRYAFAQTPLGEPMLGDPDRGLFVGGDWTTGARAEDAWRSAMCMAEAVTDTMVSA